MTQRLQIVTTCPPLNLNALLHQDGYTLGLGALSAYIFTAVPQVLSDDRLLLLDHTLCITKSHSMAEFAQEDT